MRAFRPALIALSLSPGCAALAQEMIRPAELPPRDYQGQQYVDSKGCLFMRAGTPGNEMWLPRVTREGVPLCGNPPSGRRVPVAEEGASLKPLPDADVAEATPVPTADPAPVPAASAGFYVAVGSFGVAANADAAEARVRTLNYAVARRPLGSGLTTVLAGPFPDAATAASAQQALRGAGFPDAVVMGI